MSADSYVITPPPQPAIAVAGSEAIGFAACRCGSPKSAIFVG